MAFVSSQAPVMYGTVQISASEAGAQIPAKSFVHGVIPDDDSYDNRYTAAFEKALDEGQNEYYATGYAIAITSGDFDEAEARERARLYADAKSLGMEDDAAREAADLILTAGSH